MNTTQQCPYKTNDWLVYVLQSHDYTVNVKKHRVFHEDVPYYYRIILMKDDKYYRLADPDINVVNKQLLMLIKNLAN